jgi:hypothetical protein
LPSATTGASLGALTLLTGCDVSDSFSAESILKQISKFNDAVVQGAIFNPHALAPTAGASPLRRSRDRYPLLQEIDKFDDRPGRVAYGEKGVRVVDLSGEGA